MQACLRSAVQKRIQFDQPYSITLAWMRCKLASDLLSTASIYRAHSAGERAHNKEPFPTDLVVAESS